MDKAQAKKYADYTFKEVFGRENPFSLDEIEEKFAFGISLPQKAKDSISGKEVWLNRKTVDKAMSQDTFEQQEAKGIGMRPKTPIKSMDDIFGAWDDIVYAIGDRSANSTDCVESDGVYDSTELYRCAKTLKSQRCAFCYDVFNDRYCIACSYAWNSTSVIRAIDSRAPITQSFGIFWCGRISRCLYLSNCMDMYECMFCANVRRRKYCIANMQFTREEYNVIKEMVVDWTIKNFGPKNSVLF